MEEVWLNHFLARVVGSKPKWTRQTVAERLDEINTKSEELKKFLEQIKQSSDKSQSDSLLKKATELKGTLETLLSPLKDPSFEKYRQRILKTQRNKKWKQKKKELHKQRKQEIANENKLVAKAVEEWSIQKDQEATEHKKVTKYCHYVMNNATIIIISHLLLLLCISVCIYLLVTYCSLNK
jgi:hypothetical protein